MNSGIPNRATLGVCTPRKAATTPTVFRTDEVFEMRMVKTVRLTEQLFLAADSGGQSI